MPTLVTLIQQSIGSPNHSNQTRKRNKRYPTWKVRGKTVIICRKPERLHTKTTRTDKQIQQGSSIQDKHTEIGCTSLH